MTRLLEVEGLDVSYGPVQVLFGVSLHVDEGEVLALLGTNGAGKSTLLRAVSGLLAPSRGTIQFAGTELTSVPPHKRVARGIVQLAGGRAVFPTLTVRENLRAGAFTFLDDEERLARRLDVVLDLFPSVRDRLGQPAGTLSGGEQQMVALAKALLPEPRLLIIDELSLGLAPVVIGRLLTVIDQLRAEGMSMLVVEQSLNVAASFADRATFMERGEIRFSGSPQDLVHSGEIARAVFLGADG